MTNLQIDRALALAIGWQECELRDLGGSLSIDIGEWRTFSHLDPAVIWPIAERFNAFPQKIGDGKWYSIAQVDGVFQESVTHANPATAVALAVIESHKY